VHYHTEALQRRRKRELRYRGRDVPNDNTTIARACSEPPEEQRSRRRITFATYLAPPFRGSHELCGAAMGVSTRYSSTRERLQAHLPAQLDCYLLLNTSWPLGSESPRPQPTQRARFTERTRSIQTRRESCGSRRGKHRFRRICAAPGRTAGAAEAERAEAVVAKRLAQRFVLATVAARKDNVPPRVVIQMRASWRQRKTTARTGVRAHIRLVHTPDEHFSDASSAAHQSASASAQQPVWQTPCFALW
jgi:hypothetical protein